MINFFKDSLRELKHVVWPTREETRNYFFIVVITLILFGVYLFAVSTVFTKTLFTTKWCVNNIESCKRAILFSNNEKSAIDPKAFIDTFEKPKVAVDGVKVTTKDAEKTITVSASGAAK